MLDKKPFIGKYCDVQTKDGVWRLGYVEGNKGHRGENDMLEIALDGWSANRNHKVCWHSKRIQPPRYYSRGYTGSISYPLRNIDFDLTQISYIVNWLKLCHNFDFQNLPILDITNVFRCQMFIIVDQILFHQWKDINEDTIEEDLKKVENLFINILQISVMYLEKLPRFVSEITNISYELHSYLQSSSVCFLEASYELFLSLKNIFGFTKRSEDFFSQYSSYFKTNFLNEFIELGSFNLLCRFMKEFSHSKLFDEKFYLIANILDLYLKIFNRSNHQKISKSNQLKYINEIINFLNRENFVDLINKNNEDRDVISLTDSLVEFAKNNKSFVEESQKFYLFLKSINKEEFVAHKNNTGTFTVRKTSRKSSDKTTTKFSNPHLHSHSLGMNHINNFGGNNNANNYNNADFLNKLTEIENKLSKLEDRLTPSKQLEVQGPANPYNQKTPIPELNLISPIKTNKTKYAYTTEFKLFNITETKQGETKHDDLLENDISKKINFDTSNNNLLINPSNSFISVSDPYDEMSILSMIEMNINHENIEHIKKIILWRKRILEISKHNGWIVGKILAANTIRKLEINDSDIIEANLTFLDKFNIANRNSNAIGENEHFYMEIDYRSLFREYEKELLKALQE